MNSLSAQSSSEDKAPAIRAERVPWWRQLNLRLFSRRETQTNRFLGRLVTLLRMPPPDPAQMIGRVIRMERDIVLPIKAAAIAMLVFSFFFSTWIGMVLDALDIAVESTQYLSTMAASLCP